MAAPLIAIVGPTGAGKSALALRLAQEAGGEIVSCDSLQVYRGLDIGSAKATVEERRLVPHHLLDVVDPDQDFSAAQYARQARAALADIASRGRLSVVAGGTGIYLRALFQGLFEGPPREEALRARFEGMARRFGDGRLHRLLQRVDAPAARRIAVRDRVRVVRALEVYWTTGRPITDHHRAGREPLTGFRTLRVGLFPGRPVLRAALVERTSAMFDRGLLGEVRDLLARGYSPDLRPLRAIGYRQAVAVVRGQMTREAAERDMVTATLRFAKRQMTWFRQEADVVWCADTGAAERVVREWWQGPSASS